MRALVFCLALAAGCAGGGYQVSGAAYVEPELVYVRPGVYAVANWHDPVFYANDYYWRYDAGRWYRSRYHTGGWRRAYPPVAVRRIDRPSSYTYYRPSGRRVHVDVREERIRRDRGRYEWRDRDGRRYRPYDGRDDRRDRVRRRPYVIDRDRG